MSSQYQNIKSSKLKLKGEKKKHKKKSKKKPYDRDESKKAKEQIDKADEDEHGGWWAVDQFRQISGPIVIEMKGCYVKSLDDGSFTLGAPHDSGAQPDPEEVLLSMKIDDSKIAFKSGYNKYLGIDKSGKVVAISEAVGPMEKWEPVFQDGKLALLGANSLFMTLDDSTETVKCTERTAGDNEMVKIRSNNEREVKKSVIPEEELGSTSQVEVNYIKKFQKTRHLKYSFNDEAHEKLKNAKKEGILHEAMLDRRAQMKADRYCK